MGTRTLATLNSHPSALPPELDADLLAQTIDELTDCAQTCVICADADLSEHDVAPLTVCIRTCLDCADICSTTARVLSRRTGYDPALSRSQLQACILVCQACADECGRHASMHEHCRICAESCRACLECCERLLTVLS